ncbi:ROK family protein [Streptomyces sp. NPDC047974]|uniref:ROK family protein n=1 Tax=Streptomyces sp. NPDC047974 TaxID=3154343 RepID=UPI003408D153
MNVVALEVGGAYIKGCALGPDGILRERERWFTRPERGPDAVLETVLECAATLARRSRAVAAGIVVPGVVDDRSGRAVLAGALGWREMPVRGWVAEHLEMPVAFGHDVRAGGLAEARLGAGRGCRNFLFVSVGAGIAAAWVLDGQVVPGGQGGGGELGHLVVRPGGELCHCGGRGCLETIASSLALTRRYSLLTRWRGVGAGELYHRADAGDAVARAVCAEAVEALAATLATAVTLYAPERLVIGGELGAAGEGRLAPLRDALARRLTFQAMPEVLPAAFGDRSGCMGAALLAQELRREVAAA